MEFFYQPIPTQEILQPLDEWRSSHEYMKLSADVERMDKNFRSVHDQFGGISKKLDSLEKFFAESF